MQTQYDVLIIGGGFSGTMVACQLARYSRRDLAVAIIERNGKPGRGLAYRSQCPQQLLNVPSSNMSAFSDQNYHFVEWLTNRAPELAKPAEFVSRSLFGQYIGELFDRTRFETPINLQWIDAEVCSIRQEARMLVVQLLSGTLLDARYVVLATGNFPPSDPAPFGQNGKCIYAKYAWSDDALGDLDYSSILLLGSGLTAIDQAVALYTAAYRGRIYMLSRRGLIPSIHRLGHRWSSDWAQHLPDTARGLLSAVRRQVRQATSRGIDWRAVIDSLRPYTQIAWRALPLREQKRFLRHVRPYWEAHRHRYAPQIQQILDELRTVNRLIIIAGRVLECRYEPYCAEIRYRTRATGQESILWVDRIVNCTGPESDFRKLDDSLTRSIIMLGLGRLDALSLGFDVAEDGALLDANGTPSQILFAIGPLRKGCLWETTAVPEIRDQATTLARCLVAKLNA